MNPILRSVLGVVAGIITAGTLITIIEMVGHLVHPPPPGLDLTDPAAIREYSSTLPAGVFAIVLVAWIVGAFAGAWVAARIAGRSPVVHGAIIAILVLAGAVGNMLVIPHPIWMVVLAIVLIPVMGYLGGRMAGGTPAEA